jgi:hypothetical protein
MKCIKALVCCSALLGLVWAEEEVDQGSEWDSPTPSRSKSSGDVGSGFYIGQNLGVTYLPYALKSPLGEEKSRLFLPSIHSMLGYNFKVGQFVVGADLRLSLSCVTPGVSFGYVKDNCHYMGGVIGYNAMPIILEKAGLVEKAVEYYAVVKDLGKFGTMPIKSATDSFSGWGIGLAYRYYTASKLFFGLEARAHYYAFTATVATANGMVPAELSMWDTSLNFTVGCEF